MKKAISCPLLLIALACTSAIAQVIHVPDDQPTIQAGIDVASTGDTVLVAEGTYYENIDFKGKAITVASNYLIKNDLPTDTLIIKNTIINGSQPVDPTKGSVVSILDVPSSKATLIGFTITGGSGSNIAGMGNDFIGGGILIFGNGAIIKANYIINNRLEYDECAGAGLVAGLTDNDTLFIQNNKVAENEVISRTELTSSGGIALVAAKNAVVRISNNRISHNKVTHIPTYGLKGGGLYIQTEYSYGADIQVFNNIINYNEIYCGQAMAAGIYVVFPKDHPLPTTTGQVRIFNNLIHNNYSQDRGGGIVVWNMVYNNIGAQTPLDPLIYNNTIVNNEATEGAGLAVIDAKIGLFNNILHNNGTIAENHEDELYFNTKNYPQWTRTNRAVIFGEHNNIKGGWANTVETARAGDWVGEWYGKNNIDSEPLLDSDTFIPAELSECIGNGATGITIDDEFYPTNEFDFHNNIRPHTIDAFVDIGAVESAHPRLSTSIEDCYPSMAAYPIPVSNTLVINLDLQNPITPGAMGVFSTDGKEVIGLSQKITDNKLFLDVSKLKRGVYILKMNRSSGVQSLRFIKD